MKDFKRKRRLRLFRLNEDNLKQGKKPNFTMVSNSSILMDYNHTKDML